MLYCIVSLVENIWMLLYNTHLESSYTMLVLVVHMYSLKIEIIMMRKH